MRIVRQIIFSFILLLVGLVVLVRFLPAARDMAAGLGVPENVLSFIAPQAQPMASGDPKMDKGAGPGRSPGMGPGGFGGPALVVVKPATLARIYDHLTAIGDGSAIQSVDVTSPVGGVLAKVSVASGQMVKAGDVIAQLVDDGEVLAVEKARVALTAAEDNRARNRDLKSIVSQAELAKAESDADTARIQLSEAELALRDRTILAPISGIAGIVSVNPGDVVATTKVLTTIDDRSSLIVDYWVPERFAPLISVGQDVEAEAIARRDEKLAGKVVAIDSRIDPASRTLRVQAKFDNGQDRLRAGMSFAILMKFTGEERVAVDPLAIQWDSQGAYVWRIVDEKAERVSVTIDERNSDSVLVSAKLAAGDGIVVEGVQRVRPGGKVRIAGAPMTADEKAPGDKVPQDASPTHKAKGTNP